MSKKKSFVDEIIDTDFPIGRVNDLYKAFIGKTKIEKAKEEEFVIRALMRGKTKAKIIRDLQELHPEVKFSYLDLDHFIERNDDIFQALKKDHHNVARRHLKVREDIEEGMASLIRYTEKLILQLEQEGDRSNQIQALKTLITAYKSYAELAGHIKKNEKTEIKNIVQIESNKLTERLKERAHNADFKIIKIDNQKKKKKEEDSNSDE